MRAVLRLRAMLMAEQAHAKGCSVQTFIHDLSNMIVAADEHTQYRQAQLYYVCP
jgi:hypothetical protein